MKRGQSKNEKNNRCAAYGIAFSDATASRGKEIKKAAAGFLQKAKLKKQKISPVTNPKAAPTNIFAISV